MSWKPAAGAARFAGAVLGGCLALSVAPVRALDATLQASLSGRFYALVDRGDRHWTLVEEGRAPILLPGEQGEVYDALIAIDGGWLAAGHRPASSGPGRELVLLRGGDGSLDLLPVPPAGGETLLSPRPLVEDGELVGLAWLEGSDARTLGVRAATWSGAGFAPAAWISPPSGAGSQLALSAAVLRDRSWLLVWSAFDGGDDEILWSVRGGPDGPGWSTPARLHADNAVPDITPVVAATWRGAVAAWSRYEAGHYRVRVARFHDGAWRGEERLGGPGSVFPFFVADEAARGPSLVFPTGVEGWWELVELGGSGQVTARTRWAGRPREAPLARRGPAGGARLEWLGDDLSPAGGDHR
ncbi:MAG TPA: hypothetical protein VMS86_06865 [Thermoanaerobaculia bacterium]|nr:hypothetical protein [Thermoanaerobaculia bacterium]